MLVLVTLPPTTKMKENRAEGAAAPTLPHRDLPVAQRADDRPVGARLHVLLLPAPPHCSGGSSSCPLPKPLA